MIFVIVSAISDSPVRDALVVFYHTTGGPDWTHSTNWLSEEPLHTWYGIRTDETHERVIALHLPNNHLTGYIPAAIGQLRDLQHIFLADNELSGRIPAELGHLGNLERLLMYSNALTGELPGELGLLSNLVRLNVSSNELTGELPGELGLLSNLVSLDVSSNALTGELPGELGLLGKLENLYVASNELTGALPGELGLMGNLVHLDVSSNALTGELPGELGLLSNLERLDVSLNALTGELPGELGNLGNLERLDVSSNALTGELPEELGQLGNLERLDVSTNALTGALPEELGNLGNLVRLSLYNNKLTGELPEELGLLGNLEQLDLNNNQLTGRIPPDLGGLGNLEQLILSNNQLVGTLPSSSGGLTALKVLDLRGNWGMAGILPRSMTGLGLDALLLYDTRLCVPEDSEYDLWLQQISIKDGIGGCKAFLTKTTAILVQATQSTDFSVPLVAGEDALLRVFIKAATDMEIPMPSVTARFYLNGIEVFDADLQNDGKIIPIDLDLANLETSSNMLIPGSVIEPGLEMVIDIDPDNVLGEIIDLPEDRLPMTGRMPIDVREVPSLELTLVPFLWTEEPELYESVPAMVQGLTVDSDLFRLTRDILPVNRFELSIHEPVWTENQPEGLSALEDTELVYTMEGKRGHYMGIVSFSGVARSPGFVSVSKLDPVLVAHELGHNMALLHAPCGSEITDVDPFYPYEEGEIGVWGYDLLHDVPIPASTPDLMTYCSPPAWISDFNFTKSIVYRATEEEEQKTTLAASYSSAAKNLLIWGGVSEEGELFLRHAFAVDAPPSLPDARGPYRLEGVDAVGNTLFMQNFSIHELVHSDGGVFVFIVPMRNDWTVRLRQIELSGPEGFVEMNNDGLHTAALLLDESTNMVRGIFREWSEPGVPIPAARPMLPEPGLKIVTSPGIPDASDWNW